MSLRIKLHPDLSGPLYHYNNTAVLRFSKSAWQYYLELPDGTLLPVRGVTNTLKIIGGQKTEILIGWSVRKDFEKFLSLITACRRRSDGFVEAPWEDIEGIVDIAKREHKQILDTAGSIGHGAHEHLELIANSLMAADDRRLAELLAKWPENEASCNAAIAAVAFLVDHNVRFIASEQRVFSREWMVAGTMDADWLIDSCTRPECPCQKYAPFADKRVVGDYKSSNYVYSSMMGQMALYRKAKCEEAEFCGQPIKYDGSVLLRIGKDDLSEFEPFFVFGDGEYEKHLALFKRSLDLKESVDEVDAWMKGIRDEVREKEKAAKAEAKLAEHRIRCPKADDYKGKRMTKCLPDGSQCQACKLKYEEQHETIKEASTTAA